VIPALSNSKLACQGAFANKMAVILLTSYHGCEEDEQSRASALSRPVWARLPRLHNAHPLSSEVRIQDTLIVYISPFGKVNFVDRVEIEIVTPPPPFSPSAYNNSRQLPASILGRCIVIETRSNSDYRRLTSNQRGVWGRR